MSGEPAHVLGPVQAACWRRCSCGLLIEASATICPIEQAYLDMAEACRKARAISDREEVEFAAARFAFRG